MTVVLVSFASSTQILTQILVLINLTDTKLVAQITTAKATPAFLHKWVGYAFLVSAAVEDSLTPHRSEKVIIFLPMCVSLLFHLLKCWTYYEFVFHP